MDQTQQNLEQLAAAFNEHQITDDQGQLAPEETTSVEEPAPQEMETPVEEAETVETPIAPKQAPKAEAEDDENQLAADETGKRYVPEKRFDKVYGEKKRLERELEQLKAQQQAPSVQQPIVPSRPVVQPGSNKADLLETELLFQALPQFDPGNESEYSRTLDEMAAEVYLANPGMTKLQAARKAIARARDLSKVEVVAKQEARLVKSIQSDQGLTSRVANRGTSSGAPGKNASLEEQEAYLKANGLWDK